MLPVLYNNLKRIVQTDDHVMILVEMVHDARVVRMNAEHAPPEIRKWLGDSVGHWEGDTLVVDTTNFTDTPALSGASRNLHVVERFTRIDADTLALPVHGRRSDGLERAVERRVHLAGHAKTASTSTPVTRRTTRSAASSAARGSSSRTSAKDASRSARPSATECGTIDGGSHAQSTSDAGR